MILVSDAQRGNGVLNYLTTMHWQYDASITADYLINHGTSVLFLSLKFHACKPEYIYKRINRLRMTALNILIVLLDVPNFILSMRELYKNVPLTIIACRSNEECALYLKGLDRAKKQSSVTIRRKKQGRSEFLGAFPGVNKSDSKEITIGFKSTSDFCRTSSSELIKIKGIGKAKAVDIIKYIKMPFKPKSPEE